MNTLNKLTALALLALLASSCSAIKQVGKDFKDTGSQLGKDAITMAEKVDPVKIEAAKRDAVELALLKSGQSSIIFQVTECQGTFKVSGTLLAEGRDEEIWRMRVSDVDDVGLPPSPPAPPNKKKLQGIAYAVAKAKYDALKADYRRSLARWEARFEQHLEDNAIDIAPNFGLPGAYSLRLVVTPEKETKKDWKIRVVARLQTRDGKSKQFKILATEKRDFPQLQLEKSLPAEDFVFYAK
jgi:predicted small secreted protein